MAMKPFTLPLPNKATLTGLHNLPRPTATTPAHQPLIVAIHGGGYDAQYFDVDETHTIAQLSTALGVPVVAITRPCYGGTTSFYPIPEDSSFFEQTGDWLHAYILPALWTAFGQPHGCSTLVLLCHSLGTPGAVIAAARHAAEEEEAADQTDYPLGGLILSGFGTRLGATVTTAGAAGVTVRDGHIYREPASRDALLLNGRGTADAAVYAATERLSRPMPVEERLGLETGWFPRWVGSWGSRVRVPVMLGVAGEDGLWEGTRAHLEEWMAAFSGSARVDGSVVVGAPHCVELSYWGPGWYARCFGFAMECAVSSRVMTRDNE